MYKNREKFGAGSNLIIEMQLNDSDKYNNFFRMGSTGFEELLSLVAPYIRKVDIRRQPIDAATRLGVTLR